MQMTGATFPARLRSNKNKMPIFPILRDRPKLCFFHLPRTGGTSLAKDLLFRNFPRWRWCHVNFDQHLRPLDGAHDPLRWSKLRQAAIQVLAGHMPFGFAARLPGHFQHITFLRAPVARAVSDYYFLRRNPSNPASAAARRLSLIEFVEGDHGSSNNCYARWLSNAAFGATFPSDTAMLETALRNLALCSFVGITEQFGLCAQRLCLKFHLRPYDASERNRNRATPPEFSLSPQERDMIERRNRLDLIIYSRVLEQVAA
jgi:hypothetical protein